MTDITTYSDEIQRPETDLVAFAIWVVAIVFCFAAWATAATIVLASVGI